MAADDFFSRWSKKNNEAQQEQNEPGAAPETAAPAAETGVPAPAIVGTLPTLEDAARLTPDADFSAFMARGVDETVKRAAMKKLFSDPHFNIMDGLDIYIDDYNKFEALTPDIVATLNHAKSLLDPLSQSAAPAMRLLDVLEQQNDAPQRLAKNETLADTVKQAIDGVPQQADPEGTEQAEQAEQTGNGMPPVSD